MTSQDKKCWQLQAEAAEWNRSARMNRWLLECLDAVTNLIRPPGTLPDEGPDPIYASTANALRRVIDFRALGFWIVDKDTHEFEPAYMDPDEDLDSLVRELEFQVDEGTFAWAVRHNSPVVVPAEDGGRVLLHVLATQSSVVGMFLGIPQRRNAFLPQASQKLISIMLAYCASVLETRSLHESLNNHSRNLEKQVAQRTAELERAMVEAKEADRVKGEFLAMMSHEIRTPLNGVAGMTELLLDTELSDEQNEFVRTVRASSDALLTIMNDILDFSKIDANQLSLEKIEFDLRTTVEETLELVAPDAAKKDLDLTLLASPSIPERAFTDPGRLRQVLLNLLSNAVKFTNDGEVTVRLHVVQQTASHTLLGVDVSDTGIGIPVERQEKLFQPFVQVDATSTRRYGGTGLGLAISKRLVNLMGGNIGVRSLDGRGSTFWFTVQVENRPSEADKPISLPDSLHGVRALVADNHTTSRQMLRQQLEAWQLSVDTVESGEDALQMLEDGQKDSAPFGLALLAVNLKDVDALELARKIKANENIKNTALVLLTPAGVRGDASAAESAGFAGYLPKPIRQSTLHRCVVSVLGSKDQGSSKKPNQLVTQHSAAEEAAKTRARVLIAEDNLVNQKVAARILKNMGCRVDVVDNGLKAVEALQKTRYDIVFMDCQMPEMDGYQATAEIRRLEENKRRTTIVALTANAMPGDREKCVNAGMDDYVAKPVKKEQLDRVLTCWVSEEPGDGSGDSERKKVVGGEA